MTGDAYIKRIWGEYDLRGRIPYLSVLNLVKLYDATKRLKYKEELDKRVEIMLELQKEQVGNLLVDRYGYSQTYVAQGLYKYYQLTQDKRIEKALVNHARYVRKIPPLNHDMEACLASIYPLLLDYEFTGEKIYFKEVLKRAQVLKVGNLQSSPGGFKTQEEYSQALLNISHLPKDEDGKFTNGEMNQGLRVFGWIHAFNLPYLLYWLDKDGEKKTKRLSINLNLIKLLRNKEGLVESLKINNKRIMNKIIKE